MSTEQENPQHNEERLQVGIRIRITAKTWAALKAKSRETRKPMAWIIGDMMEERYNPKQENQ